MRPVDVTIVVNGHREGLLAPPSLRSVDLAVHRLSSEGAFAETIAVLDRPDALTLEVFTAWAASRQDLTLLQVDHGDLGKSRNAGVSAARGEWVAFLDADDLWGETWLSSAYFAAEKETRRSVWHPETNLYFGERPHIFTHIDMDDPEFSPAILALTNPWTALCFAKRSLLLEVPYSPTAHQRQIGYEDWGWNMATIDRGAIHKIVPRTAHAIRTKSVSLLNQTTAAACLPQASTLLRNILAKRSREESNCKP